MDDRDGWLGSRNPVLLSRLDDDDDNRVKIEIGSLRVLGSINNFNISYKIWEIVFQVFWLVGWLVGFPACQLLGRSMPKSTSRNYIVSNII